MAEGNDKVGVAGQLDELERVLESVEQLAVFMASAEQSGRGSLASTFEVLAGAGLCHLDALRQVLVGVRGEA